uniref:Uncharacterized protein n=1 Tax=Triticum urartu TaxID=4572 RepID=A0A8R7QS58_TRIUA
MYRNSLCSMYLYLCYGMSTLLSFHWLMLPARPSVMETPESRLAPARNRSARFLCCSCCTVGDGASALRAQCPVPMGTRCASTFTMRLEQPLPMGGGDGGEAGLLLTAGTAPCLPSLWRLQRNEPGWFVGEHMQDRRILAALPTGEEGGDRALTDLTGEPPAESLTREREADW